MDNTRLLNRNIIIGSFQHRISDELIIIPELLNELQSNRFMLKPFWTIIIT